VQGCHSLACLFGYPATALESMSVWVPLQLCLESMSGEYSIGKHVCSGTATAFFGKHVGWVQLWKACLFGYRYSFVWKACRVSTALESVSVRVPLQLSLESMSGGYSFGKHVCLGTATALFGKHAG